MSFLKFEKLWNSAIGLYVFNQTSTGAGKTSNLAPRKIWFENNEVTSNYFRRIEKFMMKKTAKNVTIREFFCVAT